MRLLRGDLRHEVLDLVGELRRVLQLPAPLRLVRLAIRVRARVRVRVRVGAG